MYVKWTIHMVELTLPYAFKEGGNNVYNLNVSIYQVMGHNALPIVHVFQRHHLVLKCGDHL